MSNVREQDLVYFAGPFDLFMTALKFDNPEMQKKADDLAFLINDAIAAAGSIEGAVASLLRQGAANKSASVT